MNREVEMKESCQTTQISIGKKHADKTTQQQTPSLSRKMRAGSEGTSPSPVGGAVSPEGRAKKHKGLSQAWKPRGIFQLDFTLLGNGRFFFFFPFAPVLNRNVYKCYHMPAPLWF